MTASSTVAVRRALLSVSDKTGVIDLARALAALGVELLSTGGNPSMSGPENRVAGKGFCGSEVM